MRICKTILIVLITHTLASLKDESDASLEEIKYEQDAEIFLDENEYMEVDLVDFNGLQYSAKTDFGTSNVE